MSHVGGSTTHPTTGPTPSTQRGMCDHCHIRPKYPSYNYCGKRCGLKAASVGSQTVMVVLMCKQCSVKPTYMNHEFCGRKCAIAWANENGKPLTGSLARPPSPNPNQPTILANVPSQNQNTTQGGGQQQNQQTQGGGQQQNQQTGQGGNQPGQKRGGVKGFVKGFKNLVSTNPPPQQQQQQQPQQQTATNPVQTQQPPNNHHPGVNFGSHTIPLMLRIPTGPSNQSNTHGGTSGQTTKPKLGPFNGAYPISPPSPTDDDAGVQNNPPKLGPFNGAYPLNPIPPHKQWSAQTTQPSSTLPSQSTAGPSNQPAKPRLGPFNGAYPISPPSPTDDDAANQNPKPKLGPFNGAYRPVSPIPIKSISSGSSVLQTPNDATPGTTPNTTPGTTPAQNTDNVWKELSHTSHSTDSLSYASEDEDAGAGPGQASHPDQDAGNDGDAEGDTVSISYSVYPPSTAASEHVGICRMKGCSSPTFVDPITDLESEYCSWKHQEEATAPKEEALCIMCHKMPRGSNDHFCSKECREMALCP